MLAFYRTRVRSLGMLVSNSLTDSLTHSCLVKLIDVTLAFEDVYSKLVEVVTVAHVDDDNSLVQTLSTRGFGQDFEVDVQARF